MGLLSRKNIMNLDQSTVYCGSLMKLIYMYFFSPRSLSFAASSTSSSLHTANLEHVPPLVSWPALVGGMCGLLA